MFIYLKRIIQLAQGTLLRRSPQGFLTNAAQMTPRYFWNGTCAEKQLAATGHGPDEKLRKTPKKQPHGTEGPAPEEGGQAGTGWPAALSLGGPGNLTREASSL